MLPPASHFHLLFVAGHVGVQWVYQNLFTDNIHNLQRAGAENKADKGAERIKIFNLWAKKTKTLS